MGRKLALQLAIIFMGAHQPYRYAHVGSREIDRLDHQATRSHRDVASKGGAVDDRGAGSKEDEVTDAATPGNGGIYRNMYVISDCAFMFDNRACVKDAGRSNASHGTNVRVVADEATGRDQRADTNAGMGLNQCCEWPRGLLSGSHLKAPSPIVA
jgi:hypothetical protein